MGRRRVWRNGRPFALGVLVTAAVAAACTERFEGNAGCPLLCPEQNVTVLDTLFEPIVLDTTVTGYPLRGTETTLLLARRGDTLDTRPVIRFDSLLKFFTTPSGDSAIEALVDTPYVRLLFDKVRSRATGPVTIDVFDVDTIVGDSLAAAEDTTTAIETMLFRPDRRVGSVTLDSLVDSVRVPLDSAIIESKILEGLRLRLGFSISSAGPAMLLIVANEGGNPAIVRYDPTADTTIGPLTVFPGSKVPRSQPVIASDLADYVHVISQPPLAPWPLLTAGGVPGRRVYLRFDVPSRIIDSSDVLRATLLITQAPARGLDDTISVVLYPHLVTAGRELPDIGRSAYLIGTQGAGFDSVRLVPRDSGLVSIEVVNALRAWSLIPESGSQRALVLRSTFEGRLPGQITFFSTEADPALRPRLRVSYSPHQNFGIP